MAKLATYFTDFLTEINLREEQRNECKSAQIELRERLSADDELKNTFITTFIQGSYRRQTIIDPPTGKLPDVDVVLVTKIHESDVTKWRKFIL